MSPVSKKRKKTRRPQQGPRWRRLPDMSSAGEQPGMVNGYRCDLGHAVYVEVADPGVTPSGIGCPHREERGNPPVTVECGLRAVSMFYDVPAWVLVTHEWYRPDDAERRRLDRDAADYVNRGGLLLRELAQPREISETDPTEGIEVRR